MFQIHEYSGADGNPLRYGKLTNPNQPTQGGKAMLFVPGLGGSVKGALSFLEQLLPEYSPIYGPDLRGFGLNLLETDPLTSAKIVSKDLEAFYQQVIAPQQHSELVLCGLSLGGVLSTLLAARHPDRFSRLILLAPAYRPHRKTFSLSYTVRNTLAYLIKGSKARTQLPYGLQEITSNPDVLSDPQYTSFPPLVLSPGFLLGVRDFCNQAFSEIRRIQIPTLMVIPGQDIVCDPDAMRKAFDRIPQTTPKLCKEYPDFYHDVLFEAGHSEIAQEILGWPLPPADPRASCSASLSSI
jgi:alpha-beta hydrolase superfamily lysophospholipase